MENIFWEVKEYLFFERGDLSNLIERQKKKGNVNYWNAMSRGGGIDKIFPLVEARMKKDEALQY